MDNVVHGPWQQKQTRRSLEQLVALAGGLGEAVSVACEPRPPVDPSLLMAFGAKLEGFAAFAKTLSDEAKSVHRYSDAVALLSISSTLEHRAANIELDLGLFE